MGKISQFSGRCHTEISFMVSTIQTNQPCFIFYFYFISEVGEQPFRAVMVKERKGSHHGQDSTERTEVFRQQNEQHHGTDQMN